MGLGSTGNGHSSITHVFGARCSRPRKAIPVLVTHGFRDRRYGDGWWPNEAPWHSEPRAEGRRRDVGWCWCCEGTFEDPGSEGLVLSCLLRGRGARLQCRWLKQMWLISLYF